MSAMINDISTESISDGLPNDGQTVLGKQFFIGVHNAKSCDFFFGVAVGCEKLQEETHTFHHKERKKKG
jgi:predicted secreted protein